MLCFSIRAKHRSAGMDFPPRFSAAHQQARIHCISELEDVVVVGEVAYTLCRDSLSVTPPTGGTQGSTPVIVSRYTASNPTAAGSWPVMPTRCPRWRSWGREMRTPNQPFRYN